MRNQFRHAFRPDKRWRRVKALELLQHGEHVIGLTAVSYLDVKAESAMLFYEVKEHESAAVSRGFQLVFRRSYL